MLCLFSTNCFCCWKFCTVVRKYVRKYIQTCFLFPYCLSYQNWFFELITKNYNSNINSISLRLQQYYIIILSLFSSINIEILITLPACSLTWFMSLCFLLSSSKYYLSSFMTVNASEQIVMLVTQVPQISLSTLISILIFFLFKLCLVDILHIVDSADILYPFLL